MADDMGDPSGPGATRSAPEAPDGSSPSRVTPPIALLPCPFCGGEAGFNTVHYHDKTVREQSWSQAIFHGVNCVSCGANNRGIVGHKTPALAADKWNARAGFAPVTDPIGWRRVSPAEARRIGAEAIEKGWTWKDNKLHDGDRPVMLANHPAFPPTYWVPDKVTPLDIEVTRVTGNLTHLRNSTSDESARAWCADAVKLIRRLAEPLDEEAAARWLMADDTAYAAEPDFARRAARHMLAAAQGIEADRRKPEGVPCEAREPDPVGDALESTDPVQSAAHRGG